MAKTDRPSVAIVDFGLGNLFSVRNACDYVGLDPNITSFPKDIMAADAVILPGVGAFGDAMSSLTKLDMVEPLREVALSNKPLLAICLGMQLLMAQGNEFGVHSGLDIIQGSVFRLGESKTNDTGSSGKPKVPHIGWSQIYRKPKSDVIQLSDCPNENRWNSSLFNGLSDGDYMYFVHSFYVEPTDVSVVSSVSYFGGLPFCSSLKYQNVYGCQFHPERSGPSGLNIYRNFALLATGYNNNKGI